VDRGIVFDGRYLFSLSVQQRECSVLNPIERTLKRFDVFLLKTNKKVTGSRRIWDTLGSQYPQYALCFLQPLDVVDDLATGEKVVYEVQNVIRLEVRLVPLQYINI